MKRGMNSSEMQKANRSLVLRTLFEKGNMTRTELSNEVGLQKATITNIINEFLDMGIIDIAGDTASGRRGELLHLVIEGVYTMSISLNRKNFKIAVFSIHGEQLDFLQIDFHKDTQIQVILSNLTKNASQLMDKYGRSHIIGITLGIPGPYIRKHLDDSESVAIVSGWEQLSNINIHTELEKALGCRILSEHDAKLSAYAEWKNTEEAKHNHKASLMTFTSIGFGIGSGYIIDGKIVEGQLGVAGEIGHMGINFNCKRTENGNEGTFEYYAGTESAVRYMSERLYEFPDSPLKENSTYNDIVKAYEIQDPLAVWALEKTAWMLGYGIANFIFIINPDCIIIGQAYPENDRFLEAVKKSVRQFVYPTILEEVNIRCSVLKEDTVLLGGYYLMIKKLFDKNVFIDKITGALQDAAISN